MLLMNHSLALAALLLLALHGNAADSRDQPLCPIGYDLAYADGTPICYREKGPETFEAKFDDCAGNLYTAELYHKLNITKREIPLWSEYKSLYPEGPFVDWSFTASTGDVLEKSLDVKYIKELNHNEELCVIIDAEGKHAAVSCKNKYYRYCFVDPYPEIDNITHDGCEWLPGDYWRFYSPRATCLTQLKGAKGGRIRASWQKAREHCTKVDGSLLHRGWRYANNPKLRKSNRSDVIDPLDAVIKDGELYWYQEEDGNTKVLESDWKLVSVPRDNKSVVALEDGAWTITNYNNIFTDVICERSIHLNNVQMDVKVENDVINLYVNDTIEDWYKNIKCYTDAISYVPQKTSIQPQGDNYVVKSLGNGYYWCIQIDSKNFRVAESNRALYIGEDATKVYVVKAKLRDRKKYELKRDELHKDYEDWVKKLRRFIYKRMKYKGLLSDASNQDAINIKLERLYLNQTSILFHVEWDVELDVTPGNAGDLEIISVKPAYYCKNTTEVKVNRTMYPGGVPLGKSVTTECGTFKCVGDFNEGVQWLVLSKGNCSEPPEDKVRFISEVTLVMPTSTIASTRNISKDNEESSSEEDNSTPCPDDVTETSTETVTTVNTPTEEVTTVNTPTEELTTVETPIEVVTLPSPRPPRPTTVRPEITTRPRPPPDEQLLEVMNNLEQLLHNDSIPIDVENVNVAIEQVDGLLDLEDELDFPGNLLNQIDQIAMRADLNGTMRAAVVGNNVAMLMADAEPESPVKGLRIAVLGDEAFNENAFEIISEEINSTHLNTEESEAVVQLPDSVVNSTRRISFVVFRNDRAFKPVEGQVHYSVNSRVLSIKIENLTTFDDGDTIDIHLRPTGTPERNQSRSCAYWHFPDNQTGYWSQEGCTFIPATDAEMLDTCRCTHLTHFAEVLVPRSVFSQKNEDALEIISILGCVMSLFGLIIIGLTAILFRSWRKDFINKIWLQLCIAIALSIVCFLVIVFASFETYDISCVLVGVLLHYSVLASFSWMLVAAVISYRRLVLVFNRDASHKLLRASAFAWGAPCAIVGILLSAAPHSYAGRYEEKSPSGSFCYPSGLSLYLTVYAPICVMLLANWTLFVLIVRSVFVSRSPMIQRHGETKEAFRCASVSCLLVFLFGLPWIFGLFAQNIVGAYLFTMTATFQGFVLFIFFVVGNKKTRDLWLNKLKIKQTSQIPVTSSTYTNNKSSSAGWRGGNVGPAAIEANASKPRAMASPDNTRFS